MLVLVTYASKHGATQGIAERIAEALHRAGHTGDVLAVKDVREVGSYQAFVVGSAAYVGHWMKDATEFVRDHQPELSARPTWLFSSGPLGTDATDAQGRDVRETAIPKEVGELAEAVGARDHRVFFGVLDPDRLGFGERAMRKLPAGRALLPEGDFRDWAEIDQWATGIADQLTVAASHAQHSGPGEAG